MATTVPAPGAMLGRYQVLKPLAKGGMAEVWLARAIGLKGFERVVVIKRIRVEHGSDQKAIDMFLDEARLVAALHHRNIVQVLDVDEEDQKYFFVMEYVHGRDVRELLRKVKDGKQQIPLEHVLTIVSAAAAGLHYAHEQRGPDRKPLGIVHRDISPGNILVAFDGGVKVVDFGIAKADVRTADTQAGETKGKMGYMSPEQCRAQPIDRRTDVFLLGIVLWELCTVRRLFNKDSRFETMAAIAEGEIPPPSKHRKDLPAELEQIVMKALARAPEDRYQTADELRLALEAFAARAGLSLSAGRLSDYLKEVFGEVPEPWLVEDMTPPPAPEVIERTRSSGRISAQFAAESSSAARIQAPPPAADPPPAAADPPPAAADAPATVVEAPATVGEAPPAVVEASAVVEVPPAETPDRRHAVEPPESGEAQALAAKPAIAAPATKATQPELEALRVAKPVVVGEPSKDEDRPRTDAPVSWPVDPRSVRARKRWLIAIGVLALGVAGFLIAAFWGPDVPAPPSTSPSPPSALPANEPAPAPVVTPSAVVDAADVAPAIDAAVESAATIDAGVAVPAAAPSNGPTAAEVPAPPVAKPATKPKATPAKRPRPRAVRPKPVDKPATEPTTEPTTEPAPSSTMPSEPAPPAEKPIETPATP